MGDYDHKDPEYWGERTLPRKGEKFLIRALPSPGSQSHNNGSDQNRSTFVEKERFGEAGYEHLEAAKNRYGKATAQLANVDIQEHRLPFTKLTATFQTSINTKEPAQSSGLNSQEARVRLQQDGPNILTPPKKKHTFRKV